MEGLASGWEAHLKSAVGQPVLENCEILCNDCLKGGGRVWGVVGLRGPHSGAYRLKVEMRKSKSGGRHRGHDTRAEGNNEPVWSAQRTLPSHTPLRRYGMVKAGR